MDYTLFICSNGFFYWCNKEGDAGIALEVLGDVFSLKK
jgi:hypothetical protein